jgi:hypothetical protein
MVLVPGISSPPAGTATVVDQVAAQLKPGEVGRAQRAQRQQPDHQPVTGVLPAGEGKGVGDGGVHQLLPEG